MKKYFITAVTLFLLIPALKAQNISYGIKAGGNMFNLNGNLSDDADARYSFHAGVMAEIDFRENLHFQAELLYSEQGNDKKWSIGEFNNANSDYDYRFTRKYNYLILPVLAKLNIYKGLWIEAGPQAALLLSAKTKQRREDTDHSEITTLTNVKDGMHTMEFSAVGGLGYLFQSGLSFQARYIYGITNIMKPYPEGWLHIGDNVKNRGLQVSAGFLFN